MHYELKQSFFEPIARPSYATTAPSEEKLMSIHALKSRLQLPGASSNDEMWAARVRKFRGAAHSIHNSARDEFVSALCALVDEASLEGEAAAQHGT